MKVNKLALFSFFLFGCIFCSISLVNHYNFRTYAWDLGINNNAIYDYAHFRWNDCMLMQPQFKNVLSDHFSLIPILVSPLYWILGSYTMLIVQIIGILLGGFGIYKLIFLKTENKTLANWALIHFFSIWGIYSALAFDYHDNVMGAMFVPWIFYYFEKNEKLKCSLFCLLLMISKENMALWGVFIFIGIAILNRSDKQKLIFSLGLSFLFGLYFISMVGWLIPALANSDRQYLHFHYTALGENFLEAIQTLITQPLYSFKLLFINHTNDPVAYGIKKELHLMVFFSGGLLLLFRPQFLIMLIPIYAQKLFNDDYGKWGINAQYSIEFVPILTIGSFYFISSLAKNQSLKRNLAIVVTLVTLTASLKVLDSRVSKWYSPEHSGFYQKRHYIREFNVKEVHNALKLIPETASVSALSALVPHLAFRDYIYQFPVIENAEYIALLENDGTYPLNQEEFDKKVNDLISSGNWEITYRQNSLLILKKKKS